MQNRGTGRSSRPPAGLAGQALATPPASLDALAQVGYDLLKDQFKLTRSEKDRGVTAVKSIVDHTRPCPREPLEGAGDEFGRVIIQGYAGKAAAVTVLEALDGDPKTYQCVKVGESHAAGRAITIWCKPCRGQSCRPARRARDVVENLVRVLCVTAATR